MIRTGLEVDFPPAVFDLGSLMILVTGSEGPTGLSAEVRPAAWLIPALGSWKAANAFRIMGLMPLPRSPLPRNQASAELMATIKINIVLNCTARC